MGSLNFLRNGKIMKWDSRRCKVLFRVFTNNCIYRLIAGYLSDDGLPKRRGQADMSVFRDAVHDCLDYDVAAAKKARKTDSSKKSSNDTAEVEKFSGLRLR